MPRFAQVANCAQRLQLPVLPQATMISADQSVAGSVSHLLGVTPQQLLQVQVPDLPAAQVWRRRADCMCQAL